MVPEIFKKHIGVWQETVIKVNPQGERKFSFYGTFAVSVEGCNYRQLNTYTLPNGNIRTLQFQGRFENGVLIMSSSDYPEFAATAWDGGNETILFRSSKVEEQKHYTYIETMTLTSPDSRVRSTQIFRDGVFDGITYIEETRQAQS